MITNDNVDLDYTFNNRRDYWLVSTKSILINLSREIKMSNIFEVCFNETIVLFYCRNLILDLINISQD